MRRSSRILLVARATKMLYTPLVETIIGHGYRTLNCCVFVCILNMRIETYFTLSLNTTTSTVRSNPFRVLFVLFHALVNIRVCLYSNTLF